ncbi:MAG: hypothetical protein KBG70_07795 [Chitinophagales bacterium]|jgi:hypothetical protein|nr:hypothetical protein [Chitinophagales bacterium]
MKKKVLALLIAGLLATNFVCAQQFVSRHLEYLYGGLQKKCTLPPYSGIFECTADLPPLHVEYEKDGFISHLGVALFPETMYPLIGKTLCNFQERFLLELLYQADDKKVKKLLDEYKTELHLINDMDVQKHSSRNILQSVLFARTDSVNYTLVKDSLSWTASWSDDYRSFAFRFPANYDLIIGMDKKEAEDKFEDLLSYYSCNETSCDFLPVKQEDLSELKSGIFIKQGKQLFTDKMNSTMYYRKDSSGIHLLLDRNFPEQSIANMFLAPNGIKDDILIQITQKTYGNNSKRYTVSVAKLLCFLKNDFDTYFGIEENTSGNLAFTVIFQSRYYNCNHLLHVITTTDSIFSKEGMLTATLYTYIPNHNIKNLYRKN